MADEFPSERGKHHSDLSGFTVEAMFASDKPRQIAGQLLDNRWAEVSFAMAPQGFGVPAHDQFNAEIVRHGLYGYEAAQALRWWLHAQARLEGGEYCLRTRLVVHKVVTETRVTAERAICEEGYQRGLSELPAAASTGSTKR